MRIFWSPGPTPLLASTMAILVVVIAVAGLAFASPAVADEVSGSAKVTLGTGKAGTKLIGQKVRFSARSGAVWSALGRGRARTSHPVSSIVLGDSARIGVRGTIRFSRARRKVDATGVEFVLGPKGGTVKARIAGSRINLFTVSGPASIDEESGTVEAKGRTLSLSVAAGKVLRKRLGLRNAAVGPVGSLGLNAAVEATPGVVDPYLEQCGLAATSEGTGTLPEPRPLPALVGGQTTFGDDIAWGFKESFRNYVGFSGSIFGLGGATAATVPPSPAVQGFTFPHEGGTYASNDGADLTDDQAILNGTGTALFCKPSNEFRIAISDPTVVIDGENSRIVADLDTNFRGIWTPAQRIELARLDLDGITPFYNRSGAEVTWSDVPVTLTEAGSEAFRDPESPSPFYQPGEQLDPITVAIALDYPVPEGSELTASSFTGFSEYVSDELAFQLDDPATGGCSLPIDPASTSYTRTIDEDVALDAPGFKPVWKDLPGNPTPPPDLEPAEDLVGGAVEWGFRSGLRGSISGSGLFNLSSGVTASNTPYYGYGEGAVSPPESRPSGQMSGPGKFFSWPAGSGSLQERESGGDRLVIEGSGRVAFCQVGASQWYGLVLSDPTVVIDGPNSRITVDVATRYRYSWVRGRVDLASLDLSLATTTSVAEGDERVLTWSFPAATGSPIAVGPVTLTPDGEQVVNMLFAAQYTAGLGLDGLTVRARVPAE